MNKRSIKKLDQSIDENNWKIFYKKVIRQKSLRYGLRHFGCSKMSKSLETPYIIKNKNM
jgi:hypothetical protein